MMEAHHNPQLGGSPHGDGSQNVVDEILEIFVRVIGLAGAYADFGSSMSATNAASRASLGILSRIFGVYAAGMFVALNLDRDRQNPDISDRRVATNAAANTMMAGSSVLASIYTGSKFGGWKGAVAGLGVGLISIIPVGGGRTVGDVARDEFYRAPDMSWESSREHLLCDFAFYAQILDQSRTFR